MRRVVLLALLALALPISALANTVDYAGFGDSAAGTASLTGTVAASNSFTLTLDQLSINGGAFSSGTIQIAVSLASGSTSCGAGCVSYSIAGGTVGIWNGSSVSLFSGTFTSGSVTVSGGIVNIQGFTNAGSQVATVINLGSGHILGSSDTIVTPEPGTLGLLGTGLVGLAGIVRRKLRA